MDVSSLVDERYAAQALPMGRLRALNVTQAARSFFNMTHRSPDREQLFWNRSRWLAKAHRALEIVLLPSILPLRLCGRA